MPRFPLAPLVAGMLAASVVLPLLAGDGLFMGAPVQVGKTASGALINQAVLDNGKLVRHQDSKPYKLTEGVWILPGPMLNAAVIEGPEGLIVWETGEGLEDGTRYRQAIRSFSDKPIKALIYSHSHYTKGARTLLEGEKDVLTIGHPKLNENMKIGGLGSYYPEVEPLQRSRAYQHAQIALPEQGPDGKAGFAVSIGESGFVPVNTPVQHGEELVVAGVRLKFLSRGGSDTDDGITVWLPERKVALNNLVWPWMPNFYTPRGAKYREPRDWSLALQDLIDLQPEYLVNQHALPVSGSLKVQQTLNNYRDFINLVLDQTLRGILQGKGPDELRDFIKLPRHLAQDPWMFESYGQLDWYAPAIMNHALGWWDGDAATLVKLPPRASAERLVPLLGGRDKLLAEVRAAQGRGELAWALELLGYQFRLTPDDTETRQLKADLLRSSAHAATASITRAFMLSQALALEGKVRLPQVIPPNPAQIAANPVRFVDELRVRVDPIKAQDTDALMRFDFIDASKPSAALHLRRGVALFIEQPAQYRRPADFVLRLDAASFTALFLNKQSLGELLDSGKVELSGDKAAATAFLALFDPYKVF
ncbi:MBL fold metallo-hydrolase [Pseudomonas sp. GD03860]|uniref:alkyl sulfatase dimerization domain-containing protein n=1 Tax=Pseudomonas TaxID=286 RepID=UPI002363DE26|nr:MULTISPECIES: alkyl sulfatase dimerization domain-containing protein [Pseudomonas]MDD2058520.1 MBL fold metallo-hydrolase [Pseudomonas putida]MDH0640664.1 MBL fold metallo-hydrolase [Pseudomonas sp. GD03860]